MSKRALISLVAILFGACMDAATAVDSLIYQYGGGDAGAVYNTLEEAEQGVRGTAYQSAGLSFPIFSQTGWHFTLTLDYRPYGGLLTTPPAGTGVTGTDPPPNFKRLFDAGGPGGPPPQTPPCKAGGPLGGSGEGDPCIAASGNQAVAEFDFSYGAIDFSRYYNSLRTLRPYGAINYNWSHSFARRILTASLVIGHGIPASPTAAFIVAQDAEAHAEFYRLVTPGTPTTPGVFRSSSMPGRVLTVRTLSADNYEYTIYFPDGHREIFDNDGSLYSISYPDDIHRSLSISSFRQASGTLPLVSNVADGGGLGRSISFTYGYLPGDPYLHLGSIYGVRSGTTSEPLLRFIYDVAHGYQEQNLLSVQRQGPNGTFAGGKIRQYAYGENTPVPLPLHLTRIIDENNDTYATFTYDDHGRSATSILGGVANSVQLNYNANTSDQTVTVTRPLGGNVTYSFPPGTGSNADRTFRKARALSYPSTLLNPGYSESWTYGYEDPTCVSGDDRICRYRDSHGVVTEYQYDTLFERVRIEGKGTTEARRVETDYNTTVYRPSEVRVYAGETNAGTPISRVAYTYNTAGALTATCQYDTQDTVAMGYACSAATLPPANTVGVRRSVYEYCSGPSTVSPGKGCPGAGWLSRVTDPNGNATTYVYYTQTQEDLCYTELSTGQCHWKGDLASITDALGHTTSFLRYDWAGHVTSVTDPNSKRTVYRYTPEGWLDRMITYDDVSDIAGGAITYLVHDNVGNITSVTDPDNVTLTYEYDDAYRPHRVIDGENATRTVDLNGVGGVTTETIATAGATVQGLVTRQFDALGRLGSITDGYSRIRKFRYDALNRRNRMIDPNNVVTTSDYDGLNRPDTVVQDFTAVPTSPTTDSNFLTNYHYDAADNVVQVTDPANLSTYYSYDGLRNLRTVQSPDSGTSVYTYDRRGNVVTTLDARNVLANFGYDSTNRQTTISYPSASLNVTRAYDQSNTVTGCTSVGGFTPYIGRLTTLTDASGSTTYCYDARGNVVRKQQITGSATFATTYAYTAASRLSKIGYPSGAIVTYAYDATGRVEAIQYKADATSTPISIVSATEWNAFGPLRVITYGDGHTVTRTSNLTYDVTNVQSSILAGVNLSSPVDGMGNVTALSGSVGSVSGSDIMTLDGLYRLKREESTAKPTQFVAYTYSPAGDRLTSDSSASGPETYAYIPNTHRIASINAGQHAGARDYDAAGNTKRWSAQGPFLNYDDANRFSSIFTNTPPIVTSSFKVNGLGQRVAKTTASTTTYSVYDESGRLLGTYGNNASLIQEYVYLQDILVAVATPNGVFEVESDRLNTPRAIIRPSDSHVIWAWSPWQDPFGTGAPDQDVDGDGQNFVFNLRFTGQYYDSEFGLTYNYYRDYESATGRYIESDPIGLRGGVNAYAFVNSRPLNLTDSRGLQGAVPIPGPLFDLIRPLPFDPIDVLPPIPYEPAGPNDGKKNTDHCTRLYVRCIQELWGGDWSCGDCQTFCTGVNEYWPFEHCSPDKPRIACLDLPRNRG
jgi:RHS repeat-associated protein